ncbi:MAG: hypothetical protein K2L17_00640 [Muribaculaceae bacterium]|nr:hypothetical protein [Muribaculaceae bacterium]MDE6786624.1 hypothetical protein [Muribaculaceae bacterium]
MKTKLLYVIVSSEKDIYLEQGYVSMFSAKMLMPECHITILTDAKTADTFTGIRKEEIKHADEIVKIELDPNLPAQKRSRLLKTNARNYVDGDFLFIDCDTIVVKDLSDIDDESHALCACWDSHSDFEHNPYRDLCIGDAKKIGLDISNEKVYFNSGVMLVKDNEQTRGFYKSWNENYLKGYEKGVSMDQPSLEKTNIELGYPIHKLEPEWNCELKHGIRYLKDAYIVHYLCTNPSRSNDKQLFLLNEKDVFLKIKETGTIPPEIIEVIKDPFKGIAEVTHCFAGKEINFFHTLTYSFFIKRFLEKGKDMGMERLLSMYSKIKSR